MGMLVEGVWHNNVPPPTDAKGRFVRKPSTFRNWITADGVPPEGQAIGFKAQAGRYQLYVSFACPWAHRTLIMRNLKGLTDVINVSVVHPINIVEGWEFTPYPGATGDPVNNSRYVHELYTRSEPQFTGKATVPLLWDTKTGQIVSNESSEIMRMFNAAFSAVGANDLDFYPTDLRGDIDAINEQIYKGINNCVYRSGFAGTQEAYEEAVIELFKTLEWLEGKLAKERFLVGGRFTEADIRLFTTLIRFDLAYFGLFKCNIKQLADFPHLSGFTREIYQMAPVKESVHFDHIKTHYYGGLRHLNPSGIIPVGPVVDFDSAHGRERL